MIKLINLIPKSVREATESPTKKVSFIQPQSDHSYSKAAGDNVGDQYLQKNINFELDGVDKKHVKTEKDIIDQEEEEGKL